MRSAGRCERTNRTNRTFCTKSDADRKGTPMSAASARRRTETPKLASPAASEMIGLFARRNRKASPADVEAIGNLVAEFAAMAAKLSPAARQRLVARKAGLGKLIAEIATEPTAAPKPLKLAPKAPPEVGQGEGLGALVS